MTNIVSQGKLQAKGLYFDDWKMHLHWKGETIGYVEQHNGYYLLEGNSNTTLLLPPIGEQPGVITTTKTASMKNWHQILGHTSGEVITHLKNSVERVRVIQGSVSKTNECQTCALSKTHRIVSRAPDKSKTADKPFYRVTYNLMQFITAMNKDQWVSHFACISTDFNLVFTHSRKSNAVTIIQKALNIIETRYNGKIVFFWSDGKRALGGDFDKYITEKGITYESSAPDTPAQNSYSEQKKSVLATKAQAMRIDGGLLTYLWNEIIRTAGYIVNCTPMQKHKWKTPFELVVGHLSHLGHLRKIGCKAYTLDKHILRKAKLQEQAHIGHLIGYDSTNIFQVWIPSQRKIIRTRDVIFDEKSFYDPHELDLAQLTKKPMVDVIFDILNLDLTTRITEIESDKKDNIDIEVQSVPVDVTLETEDKSQNQVVHLPSSELTDHSASRLSTEFFTPEPADIELPPSPTTVPESAVVPSLGASRSGEISASVDPANILPEGVKRQQTPAHRNAYVTAFENSAQGGVTAFTQHFLHL